MHHGTWVTHVPWCMSGLLTLGGGKNIPGILGACVTRNCCVSGQRLMGSVAMECILHILQNVLHLHCHKWLVISGMLVITILDLQIFHQVTIDIVSPCKSSFLHRVHYILRIMYMVCVVFFCRYLVLLEVLPISFMATSMASWWWYDLPGDNEAIPKHISK